MARLKRRGLIWYAWIPRREGGTQLVSTRCTNKEAARAQAGELERRAVDRGYAAAQDTLTRAVVTDYVASRVTAGRSADTIKYNRQKAGTLARILPVRASDVTHKELQNYITTRLEEGVTRSTIKKELGVLSAAWKLARKNGDVFQDPATMIPDLDSDGVAKTRYLLPLELVGIVSRLLPHHAARVAWIVATGARWGESNRARREDIDFDARLVHLRGTKTKASLRRVPIIGVAESLIRWSLANTTAGDTLFPGWTNVRRDLAEVCAELGIPSVTPNDLRRTLATWLREAGIEPGLIATMLGHTTSRMVELHYGRLSPEGLRDLLENRSVGVLTNPVRLLSGDVGETGDSGPPETINTQETPGKTSSNSCPGPESNWGHADFQSVSSNTTEAELSDDGEPPPHTWVANGRFHSDGWIGRGALFHEATANLFGLLCSRDAAATALAALTPAGER